MLLIFCGLRASPGVNHHNMLSSILSYDDNGLLLPQLDVFITTADATKEPPLVTANTILSVLAADYPPERYATMHSRQG